MEEFNIHFRNKIRQTDTQFVRSVMHKINWKARLIGLKGARGIGKTTLLLQYIKLKLSNQLDKTLYISLDAVWFNQSSLLDLVESFEQKGGRYLFLDEVHKYDGWAQVLKNIYDNYPHLKIVFTGSSLLEILNARADLSRRAIVYEMQGFSFREYLAIETGNNFDILKLEDILANHTSEAEKVLEKIKPFEYFEDYLAHGYYPFYREEKELYHMRLGEVVNMILEIELPLLRQVEAAYIHKIKQLLTIIAQSVPFVPNVSKLSEKININRITLLNYLNYLGEVHLTRNLYKEANGISLLQKPSKIYLDNTNLAFLFAKTQTNKGNLRETFFANQVGYESTVTYPAQADFMVNEKYTFEIGGKNKTTEQIQNLKNAFVAADNIEVGHQNKIPLWLFGFLY